MERVIIYLSLHLLVAVTSWRQNCLLLVKGEAATEMGRMVRVFMYPLGYKSGDNTLLVTATSW